MASSKGRPSAYVMDFDGTLFSLPVDWKAVRRELAPLAGVPTEGVSVFKVVKEAIGIEAGLRERLFSLLDSYEIPAAEEATPIDGALETLARLGGQRTALVTMQGPAACRRVLTRYSAAPYFSVILTREDSLDRGAQLTMALRAMNVAAAEVLFVGDKLSDVEAGKRTGVTVAVVGGSEKEAWGADLLIPNVAALGSSAGPWPGTLSGAP